MAQATVLNRTELGEKTTTGRKISSRTVRYRVTDIKQNTQLPEERYQPEHTDTELDIKQNGQIQGEKY